MVGWRLWKGEEECGRGRGRGMRGIRRRVVGVVRVEYWLTRHGDSGNNIFEPGKEGSGYKGSGSGSGDGGEGGSREGGVGKGEGEGKEGGGKKEGWC